VTDQSPQVPPDPDGVRPLVFTPTELARLLEIREAIKHGYPEEATTLARLLTGWRLHEHGWIGR